jgi:predicted short-subunit dehydrogenase-like oxidoreductase (DUF2520 family)
VKIKTINIIGKGNVAFHYHKVMKEKGYDVKMISSREVFTLDDVESDIVIISVKDDAIKEVLNKLPHVKSLLLHTSGFTNTDLLLQKADNVGCLYPLQSLNKKKDIDFSKVPLCLYVNNEEYKTGLEQFAQSLSSQTCFMTDDQRQYLHIAAVFANNFTNHLLGISKEILDKHNIPFSLLYSIIDRTIENIKTSDDIFSLQTGPAVRGDLNIINQHINKLSLKERELYSTISKSIIEYHKK